MIIPCQNCNKKFDINQSLIPDKGRLLQCNNCNHKWFFIKKIEVKTPNNESMELFEVNNSQVNHPMGVDDKTIIKTKLTTPIKKIVKRVDVNIAKIQKKKNLFNLAIVFMISLIALILLADTFKIPLGKVIPNLEFLLYNLYESIKDIGLFIKDLN
jgi:predicted Zn finger-like uncharacterized protein